MGESLAKSYALLHALDAFLTFPPFPHSCLASFIPFLPRAWLCICACFGSGLLLPVKAPDGRNKGNFSKILSMCSLSVAARRCIVGFATPRAHFKDLVQTGAGVLGKTLRVSCLYFFLKARWSRACRNLHTLKCVSCVAIPAGSLHDWRELHVWNMFSSSCLYFFHPG